MTTELISETKAIDLAKFANPVLPNTAAALARRADTELATAERLKAIEDDDTYALIVDRGKSLAQLVTALEEDRVSVTGELLRLKRRWDDVFKPAIDAGEKALAIYRRLAGNYQRDQENKRRKAIEDAANERRKAEADRQRKLDEEAAEARAELARSVAAREPEKALEAAQRIDEVARDAATPIATVTAPVFVAPAPRAAGTSTRKTWKWRYEGFESGASAVEAIARMFVETGDRSLLPLLCVAETEVGKRVRALGEHAKIPGVIVYEDTSVAFSRKGR